LECILDSSAILAWLQEEPGHERVSTLLPDGIVTAANWAEILQKARQHGADPHEVGLLLRSLGLDVVDVTGEDGERAARIWKKGLPLSLGDRLCLAVAIRLQLPAVTTDTVWSKASIDDVEVEVLRR
jgi:PIN domain nuclease of toxin-antitoxin system